MRLSCSVLGQGLCRKFFNNQIEILAWAPLSGIIWADTKMFTEICYGMTVRHAQEERKKVDEKKKKTASLGEGNEEESSGKLHVWYLLYQA